MSRINNPDNSLPYHIRGAFRGFETLLTRHLKKYNLPISHFYILRLQWEDEGSSQNYIAKKAFMTESVASQVIQTMVKEKILKRKQDPKDARRRLVFLTAKGQKLRERVVTEGMNISKANAPDIAFKDVITTIEVLKKVRESFDIYNEQYSKDMK